jgi:hypothetical protein
MASRVKTAQIGNEMHAVSIQNDRRRAKLNGELSAAAAVGGGLVNEYLRTRKQARVMSIAASHPSVRSGHQNVPTAVKDSDGKWVHHACLPHSSGFPSGMGRFAGSCSMDERGH